MLVELLDFQGAQMEVAVVVLVKLEELTLEDLVEMEHLTFIDMDQLLL